MQDCFRDHPDVYSAELDDDEQEGQEEAAPAAPSDAPSQVKEQHEPQSESDELVPKAAFDATTSNEGK